MTGVSGDGPTREQEIRQRLEAATPEPWESDGKIVGWSNGREPAVRVSHETMVDCSSPVAMCPSEYSAMWGNRPIEDAALIAHAPADLAYLLGEVAQLREQMRVIPAETPEWTPLMAALDEMADVWDKEKCAETGTDDLVMSAEDAVAAWLAYRQRRFGTALPVSPAVSSVDSMAHPEMFGYSAGDAHVPNPVGGEESPG